MTLASKLLAAVALVMGLLAAASITILAAVFYPSYARLDTEMARHAHQRVIETIASEKRDLATHNREWAEWDDTYAYSTDTGHADFVAKNLTEEEFRALNVDHVSFINTDNSVRLTKSRRGIAAAFPVGTSLREMMPDRVGKSITGWRIVGGVPSLVALQPILRSAGMGPSAGHLMFVRQLSPARLKSLQDRAGVKFTLEAVGHGPSAENAVEQKNVIQGRVTLNNMLGHAEFTLNFATPRYFSVIGRQTIRNTAIILGAVSLLLCAVAAGFIAFLVARPLQRVARHMERIGASGALTERLTMDRRDEIGIVARGLDSMLSELQDARQRLETQTYYSGMADLAAGFLHNVRNVLAPIFTSLWAAEQKLVEDNSDRIFQAIAALSKDDIPTERRLKLAAYVEAYISSRNENRTKALSEYGNVKALAEQIELILQDHDKVSRSERPVQAVDISSAIEDSLRQIAWANYPKIEVVKDASLVAGVLVNSQRVVLIQVLGNVIKNAVEAIARTPLQGGRIEISWAKVAGTSAGDLKIADTGIGIDPGHMGSLFSRGHSTSTDRAGGIGLHWCANALAGIGGRIRLESGGSEKGATAIITLPVADLSKELAA